MRAELGDDLVASNHLAISIAGASLVPRTMANHCARLRRSPTAPKRGGMASQQRYHIKKLIIKGKNSRRDHGNSGIALDLPMQRAQADILGGQIGGGKPAHPIGFDGGFQLAAR